MEREKSSSLNKHTGFRSVQAKINGKRRAMLFLQVCLISGTLGVTWAMSILLTCTGTVPKRYVPDATDLPGRKLLAVDNNTLDRNCTEPAFHNFPLDIFTNTQRTNGAVVLHIFAALYMFFALAIVCDDYFVPSLEKICENLHLTEDVAGATFMAAGSSAPELFASIIGVFITHGDVGVGTIVGSAVFNVLCIIGVCGIFAGQVVCLSKYPLFRDTLCYILSVVALIVFIYDGKIIWWESGILVVMYAGYILIMKFNSSIRNHLFGREKRANSQTAYSELEDSNDFNSNCLDDPTKPLLSSSPPVKSTMSYTNSSVGPEDQIRSPVHYNFPEAGLRIMITKHFGPKTLLCMASRLVIHERIMHSSNIVAVTMATVDKGDIWANGGSLLEPTAEEGGDGGFNSPFSAPGGFMERAKWLLSWPILFLLYLTVPDCSQLRWKKYFLLSFLLATIWIAVFSYFMVWMVTVVGFTLGIPDVIMGITFLAAGTSVPDCMASLIVARQGLGDMAVSNIIGSNVFDILVGLGVPWVIQTLAVDLGSEVLINSRGLVYSVVLLLGSVTLTVLAIHFNGWRLDVRLGVFVILLYAVFLCFSVLIEYNVFTFVNLPMCLEL